MSGPAVHRATTLEETWDLLERYGDDGRIVAGSTAITIMLRQGLIDPAALIAIDRLPGLSEIEVSADRLEIGALVTHRRVEMDPSVREAIPVLASTFGRVANVRVRNVATVGGVLAEADYASDPPAVLLALDATVHAVGRDGPRDIAMADFVLGFYETALQPGEIVTGVSVPRVPPGAGATYEKYVTRSSEDRPCIGVAAIVRLDAAGSCAEVRVAIGAATETPTRYTDVEADAVGRRPGEAAAVIAEAYAERIDPLDDLRGSSWYRREMARVWVGRAIQTAAQAAQTATP